MRLKTSTKLAVATIVGRILLVARRLAGRGSKVEVTRDGIRWELDLTEGIDLAIYLFGRFESSTAQLFRRLIRPGEVVLDIGANIGANTLELARCVGPQGRVVAFEPTNYAVERLARNLDLNPELSHRVTLEQAILGSDASCDQQSLFYSSWPLVAGNSHAVHERHRGQLKSAVSASRWTLDRYLSEKSIGTVRLIKLDVDGAELAILEGAQATLRRFQPLIVMEIAPYVLDEQEGALEGVVQVLRKTGYVITDIATGKKLPLSASGLRSAIPDGASVNVLAEEDMSPAASV